MVMIVDSKNEAQKGILVHKCFYQTVSQIMQEFEKRGYANSADETINAIKAYHNLVQNKSKNNFNKDYNLAFKKIDDAIKNLANKVFYCQSGGVDIVYSSFAKFDYINAIISRQRVKKSG